MAVARDRARAFIVYTVYVCRVCENGNYNNKIQTGEMI